MGKSQKITSINVRVDEDVKERILAIAKEYDMTISELIRTWYDILIEREEQFLADYKKNNH